VSGRSNRSPGFAGEAERPLKPYDVAGREGLKAIFDAPHVQHWLKAKSPTARTPLLLSQQGDWRTAARHDGVFEGSRGAKRIAPRALKIARATADYLLANRYPADAAYANVAPTYALNVDKPAGGKLTPTRVEKRWLMVSSIVDARLRLPRSVRRDEDPKLLDGRQGRGRHARQNAGSRWNLAAHGRLEDGQASRRTGRSRRGSSSSSTVSTGSTGSRSTAQPAAARGTGSSPTRSRRTSGTRSSRMLNSANPT
jgi:hypothetical protein